MTGIIGYRFCMKYSIFVAMWVVACSTPFEKDRHDLVAPRIIGVQHSADTIWKVQVWNGEGVFHDQAPDVRWLDAHAEVLGTSVILDTQSTPTTVVYTDAQGQEHEASLSGLSGTSASFGEFVIERSSFAEPTDYTIATRSTLNTQPIESGVSTENMRFFADIPETHQMRWMSAHGVGSFLELDHQHTDFFRRDMVFDRDALISDLEESAEYTTVFALAIAQESSQPITQWSWTDVWYTEQSLYRHHNRWLPLELSSSVDSESVFDVAVTVVANDSAFGFQLVDASVDATEISTIDPLPCAPDEGAFQWSWIELGVCLRADVDGQRIKLEIE